MQLIQQPAYILTVLLLLVVLCEWLARKKGFMQVGAVILIILFAAVLANISIIPSAHNAPPLYGSIFTYAAPLGIFFLLLEVKLKDLRYAGAPMMMIFLVGSIATVAGVVVGYQLFSPQDHAVPNAHAIAGMYTGTYIGGSANLNAIALHYGVNKDGALFAAVNTVDNIVGTPWMAMTMLLPPLLRKFIPRKKSIPAEMAALTDEQLRDLSSRLHDHVNMRDIALLLALGFGSLFLSTWLNEQFPEVPVIIVLTTIALALAQLPFVQRLKGGKMMGTLLILLFLAVVGAFCDIQALLQSGDTAGILVMWVIIIIMVHAVIIFMVGGLCKLDWDIISIASNANIGGSTSAPVCAAGLGRPDLQLPGLLAGSVGNAIGTYAGIMVAEWLR